MEFQGVGLEGSSLYHRILCTHRITATVLRTSDDHIDMTHIFRKPICDLCL